MSLYRRGAWAAGIIVGACIAVLLADYAVSARRTPGDDRLVKSLQEQVKDDASLAAKLAAEQKQITDYRLGRKNRDRWVGWALIAASAAFLGCAKKSMQETRTGWVRRLACLRPRPSKRDEASFARPAGETACPTFDVSFVDSAVALHGRDGEAAVPLLQAIQNHYRYLPDEALRRLCELTGITPAQIAGVSSFYGQFRRSPVGRHVIRVCHGTACHVSGARQITEELRRYLAIPDDSDTDPSRTFTVDKVACLGCCSLAPVLMVDSHTAGKLTPAGAREALKPFEGTA